MSILEKIFGDLNKKEVKKLEKQADEIEALDDEMSEKTDEELRAYTERFKERLKEGETLDDILVEAFAVCREAASRSVGLKHFRVQLLGGIALHQGRIAEMKTGEGKTLVATLPAYLNALSGKGVHVVTVNDYLAKRDMEWMGKIYTFLGLSVGCIVNDLDHEDRKKAYDADITYGTNNEYGFDYLRDNMVTYKENMMQRELNYAIVDEVDSILVDEARTPLIISGQGDESTDLYIRADKFVKSLKAEEDFTYKEKDKEISLNENGVKKCEEYFKIENLSDPENMEINHHVLQALRARNTMKRDVDYIVKDGEIIIVDEFTGRLMHGRRFSEGLHQAIEAKENVIIRSESKTLATITLQNYFRMYNKLSGMTGTAKTEEDEFREIYNMDVVVIPTNKPLARIDENDAVYATEKGKYQAIADDVVRAHNEGIPVLVGTTSIEKSELIADKLRKSGVKKFNVLNAKQHEREAEIVAEAGREGAITIATNMAGRGTDIILGGNPEFEAKKQMQKEGYTDEELSFATSFVHSEDAALNKARERYNELCAKFKEERAEEQQRVRDLGGLFIIGTERHESRRIDNQLRGRCGRQGDPGRTKFCVSLQDDLMRLFGGERMQSFVSRSGIAEDEAIESSMITRSIENAQKKVEGRNFGIRKYVLQYDNVMNKQREIIYGERRRVLFGEDLKEHIMAMLRDLISHKVDPVVLASKYSEEWDYDLIEDHLKAISPEFISLNLTEDDKVGLEPEVLKEDIFKIFEEIYNKKEETIGAETLREIERMILIRVVDNMWMDHIDNMDELKNGIGLRALGQQDPAAAYAKEGFAMFDDMIAVIQEDTVKYCYSATVDTSTARKEIFIGGEATKEEYHEDAGYEAEQVDENIHDMAETAVPYRREGRKIGRNEPCPCGSGKKYKNCCGLKANNADDME